MFATKAVKRARINNCYYLLLIYYYSRIIWTLQLTLHKYFQNSRPNLKKIILRNELNWILWNVYANWLLVNGQLTTSSESHITSIISIPVIERIRTIWCFSLLISEFPHLSCPRRLNRWKIESKNNNENETIKNQCQTTNNSISTNQKIAATMQFIKVNRFLWLTTCEKRLQN